jgi:hypothetical protein
LTSNRWIILLFFKNAALLTPVTSKVMKERIVIYKNTFAESIRELNTDLFRHFFVSQRICRTNEIDGRFSLSHECFLRGLKDLEGF